jgi:DNA-binding LacI/PurR family transcriptional regulator
MTLLPHRTVASQVSEQLRLLIENGSLREWLPPERELSKTLQVGRDTLRLALAQLAQEKLITVKHGVGCRVGRPAGNAKSGRKSPSAVIALLAPEPMNRLRPNDLLWIDELKALLPAAGFELVFHHGHSYRRSKHGQALARLVRRHPAAAWILLLAKEPMQRWFQDNQIPCVVAGSGCEGIELPTVDLDYRAICSHAVNTLVRMGHRNIVLLNHRSHIGGDLASEIGFKEAGQQHSDPVTVSIAYHNENIDSIMATVRQVFSRSRPPTALIVANSTWYAATLTALAQMGMCVPRDVSLISRDDDGFLDYLIPPPARYRNNPRTFAKKILAQVLRAVRAPAERLTHTRIVPPFALGGSVAAPRADSGKAAQGQR